MIKPVTGVQSIKLYLLCQDLDVFGREMTDLSCHESPDSKGTALTKEEKECPTVPPTTTTTTTLTTTTSTTGSGTTTIIRLEFLISTEHFTGGGPI